MRIVTATLAALALSIAPPALVAGAAAVVPPVHATGTYHVAPREGAPIALPCQEDEPCWVWSRMGNRKRGVILASGKRAVVGPCRYRDLALRSLVRQFPEDRLKGDYWAMEHGCEGGFNPQNY